MQKVMAIVYKIIDIVMYILGCFFILMGVFAGFDMYSQLGIESILYIISFIFIGLLCIPYIRVIVCTKFNISKIRYFSIGCISLFVFVMIFVIGSGIFERLTSHKAFEVIKHGPQGTGYIVKITYNGGPVYLNGSLYDINTGDTMIRLPLQVGDNKWTMTGENSQWFGMYHVDTPEEAKAKKDKEEEQERIRKQNIEAEEKVKKEHKAKKDRIISKYENSIKAQGYMSDVKSYLHKQGFTQYDSSFDTGPDGHTSVKTTYMKLVENEMVYVSLQYAYDSSFYYSVWID